MNSTEIREFQRLLKKSQDEQKRRHEWVDKLIQDNPKLSYWDANAIYNDMRIASLQAQINQQFFWRTTGH